jgi:hypothetical protein
VALVFVEAHRGGEGRRPCGEARMDHDVWRREDDVFCTPGIGGGRKRTYRFSFFLPLQPAGTMAGTWQW